MGYNPRDSRHDQAYLRAYGMDPARLATTVNDGPRVSPWQNLNPPAAAPLGQPPAAEAPLAPSDLQTLDPEVTALPDALEIRFHEDLRTLLDQCLEWSEQQQVFRALAARMAMDLYQICHRVKLADRDAAIARQAAMRPSR